MNRKISLLGAILVSGLISAQQNRNDHSTAQDTLAKYTEIEDIRMHKHGNPNKARIFSSKSNISAMENPQPIAVVAHEIIEQQQSRQLSDVLQNVNGLYVTSARGGAQDSFGARGFVFGSDNMFKNGVRVSSGVFPEVAGLERVEVLKGGNAMQYGASSPGALVNMVTKKPRFFFGGSLGISAGSWNAVKPTVDVFGPLSKKVAFRMNGAYEYADSFRDEVESRKHYFNPSFVFNLSENTQLFLEADYLKHRSTPDFGIGSLVLKDGSFALNDQVSANAFFGLPGQYQEVQQLASTVTLNSQLNRDWTLSVIGSFQNYTRDYFSAERVVWTFDNSGTASYKRPLGRTYAENNYSSLQFNLNGQFKTGRLQHKMLFGADGDYTKSDAYSFAILNRSTGTPLADAGTLILQKPATWSPTLPEIDTPLTRKTTTPTYRAGVYLQDFITLFPGFSVMGGLRYNYLENRLISSLDYTKNTEDRQKGTQDVYRIWSPKVAVVYEFSPSVSIFGNYTNSFAVNTGFTASAQAIASLDLTQNNQQVGAQINALPLEAIRPSRLDQFEVGLKTNWLQGALAVNLSAYQVTNKDNYQSFWYLDGQGAVQTPAGSVSFKTYAGTVRSRGVELDITGNPTPRLSLIGGFSYNNAVYTDTPEDGFVEGQRLVRTPATTANASVFYAFNQWAKGLKVGATFYYMADRLAGWNDSKSTLIQRNNISRVLKLEDYSTLALSAAYEWKKFSIQAKINNVLNTPAVVVHENYSVNPIAPRNYYVTLTYKL